MLIRVEFPCEQGWVVSVEGRGDGLEGTHQPVIPPTGSISSSYLKPAKDGVSVLVTTTAVVGRGGRLGALVGGRQTVPNRELAPTFG